MVKPPVGTIAMLVTDVEGSKRLASQLGSRRPAVLADHHRTVSSAIHADLLGTAIALASLHRDEHAMELVGMGQALVAELAGPGVQAVTHLLGGEELAAAEQRLGDEAVRRCRRRGHAVAAAMRVEGACALARALAVSA